MTSSRWSELISFAGVKKKKIRSAKRRKYLNFNLILLLATAIPMLSVGLFNYTIDPYDVLKSPIIKGVNYSKPQIEKYEAI
jgi:hypothetical protein